jgi:hypothetical protein
VRSFHQNLRRARYDSIRLVKPSSGVVRSLPRPVPFGPTNQASGSLGERRWINFVSIGASVERVNVVAKIVKRARAGLVSSASRLCNWTPKRAPMPGSISPTHGLTESSLKPASTRRPCDVTVCVVRGYGEARSGSRGSYGRSLGLSAWIGRTDATRHRETGAAQQPERMPRGVTLRPRCCHACTVETRRIRYLLPCAAPKATIRAKIVKRARAGLVSSAS